MSKQGKYDFPENASQIQKSHDMARKIVMLEFPGGEMTDFVELSKWSISALVASGIREFELEYSPASENTLSEIALSMRNAASTIADLFNAPNRAPVVELVSTLRMNEGDFRALADKLDPPPKRMFKFKVPGMFSHAAMATLESAMEVAERTGNMDEFNAALRKACAIEENK